MLQLKVREIIERSDFKTLENKRKLPPLNILSNQSPAFGVSDSIVGASGSVGALSTHSAHPSSTKRGSLIRADEDRAFPAISISKTTIEVLDEGRIAPDRKTFLEEPPPGGAPSLASSGAYRSLLMLGGEDTPETSHQDVLNHMTPHKEFPQTAEESKEEEGTTPKKLI